MNSKSWTRIIALTLFAALGLTLSLAAQDIAKPHHHHQYHHYRLIDPGTFGGPASYNESDPPENIINTRGAAVGTADTLVPDPFDPNCFGYLSCFVTQAYVWQRGVLTDLGALNPGYSSFASAINARGEAVGVSENGQIDPLTGNYEAVAVLWKNGIVNLGTLGGNQSSANAINDRGQVVGAALNTISDPFANIPEPFCFNTFSWCFLFVPAATEAHAFRWTEAEGMQDLGTLGGPDSSASFVNRRGQIAGESFTSFKPNPSTGVPTMDPFFWENGKIVDIGTLGGTYGQPNGMNNSGQVVGTSNTTGDQANFAFLWDKKGGIQNLGTLPGGGFSYAAGINDAGEVVGQSDSPNGVFAVLWKDGAIIDLGTVAGDTCSWANWINSQGQIVGDGSAGCAEGDHAFLWENGGPIVDLQSLVQTGSGVTLVEALFINNRGEIAARGTPPSGIQHAVLLIPCDDDHPDIEGCDYEMVDAETAADHIRPMPAAQRPAASNPRTRMPDIINRLRGVRRPPSLRTPVLDPQQAPPALTVTDYLEADHQLVAGRGRGGYCGTNSSGLTGYCVAYSYVNFCSAVKRSAACPLGLKAKKPGYYQCSLMQKDYVDLGRTCTF